MRGNTRVTEANGNDKDIAEKKARDKKHPKYEACLHKDFLGAKRNQSQQEKRDGLVGTRRNFLNGKEQPGTRSKTTNSEENQLQKSLHIEHKGVQALGKSARQVQDARTVTKPSQRRSHGIKNTQNRACLQKDFLEVKRNQSLQETRNELVGTRRNFLEAKRNQRREPKQRDPRRSSQRCQHEDTRSADIKKATDETEDARLDKDITEKKAQSGTTCTLSPAAKLAQTEALTIRDFFGLKSGMLRIQPSDCKTPSSSPS